MRRLKKTPQEIREARRARRDQLARAADEARGDDDAAPADIEEYRLNLARRISRLVSNEKNRWRNCCEPSCKRHHACAAPHIHCSNAPRVPPDPTGKRTARTLARVHRLLSQYAEREEGE